MSESPQYIPSVIFPLVKDDLNEDGKRIYGELVGTGFFIGKNGYALTAAHVIEQLELEGGQLCSGLVLDDDKIRRAYSVIKYEKHPTEDVAIVQLQKNFTSWLKIHAEVESASAEYDSWGYPIEVAELPKKYEENGVETPDLIYTKGYVRRRYTGHLPVSVLRGTQFYELSDMGGHGCSGGPVILRNRSHGPHSIWPVFGVYIGDFSTGTPVGYAVRAESFESWKPSVLGKTVREESEDI